MFLGGALLKLNDELLSLVVASEAILNIIRAEIDILLLLIIFGRKDVADQVALQILLETTNFFDLEAVHLLHGLLRSLLEVLVTRGELIMRSFDAQFFLTG